MKPKPPAKKTTRRNGVAPTKSKTHARASVGNPAPPPTPTTRSGVIPPSPSPGAPANGEEDARGSLPVHLARSRIITANVEDLQSAALRGDALAMVVLVEIARDATRAVHAIFSDHPPMPAPLRRPPKLPDIDYVYSPPPKLTKVESLEALAYFVGTSKPFPTLHHFHESALNEEKTQKEILAALQHGPLRGKHHENTMAAFLWREASTALQDIGRGFEEPADGWRKAAYALPPLSRGTQTEWVRVAADYIAERWARFLYEPNTELHQFALLEFGKAKRKAENAVRKRWKREVNNLQALDRRNRIRPKKSDDYIPEAEWASCRSMKPSVPSLHQGLRDQLMLFLKRNLHP